MKKFDFNTLKINNVYYENNPTYFQFLVELINKSGSGFSRAILSTGKRHNITYDNSLDRSYLLTWINDSLPLLVDLKYSLSTKCYWILYGLTNFPICNNPKCPNFNTSNGYIGKNIKITIGYSRFCNRKCQNSHPDVQEKQKQSVFNHYGVEYSLQATEVKEKAKQSLFDSYGIINPGLLKCNRDILLIKSYNNFILTNEFDEPMFTLEEYLNRKDNTELLKFKCKKCGHIFLAKHVAGHHKHCEKCYPQCRIPIAEKIWLNIFRNL